MQLANQMVDRVQLFAERMTEVRRQLEKTTDAFDKVESSTAESGQSIITTARQLLRMGARENPKRKQSLGALSQNKEASNDKKIESSDAEIQGDSE